MLDANIRETTSAEVFTTAANDNPTVKLRHNGRQSW
jgi:hypothetical protein